MSIKRALNLIRRTADYPCTQVSEGLRKTGFTEINTNSCIVDLLITWTPWAGSLAAMTGVSMQDKWLVFENGYIPEIGKQKYYSVGLGGYNGTERFIPAIGRDLNINFKPWRKYGEHVLVVGQFGHRDTNYSMPIYWPEKIVREIRKHTDRKIIFRPKPTGRRKPLASDTVKNLEVDNTTSLEQQLHDAYCVVTWNSPSISIKALQMGVPLFVDDPTCIAKEFSGNISHIENPFYTPDRELLRHKLSNSLWSSEEISSGEVFKVLQEHIE